MNEKTGESVDTPHISVGDFLEKWWIGELSLAMSFWPFIALVLFGLMIPIVNLFVGVMMIPGVVFWVVGSFRSANRRGGFWGATVAISVAAYTTCILLALTGWL